MKREWQCRGSNLPEKKIYCCVACTEVGPVGWSGPGGQLIQAQGPILGDK